MSDGEEGIIDDTAEALPLKNGTNSTKEEPPRFPLTVTSTSSIILEQHQIAQAQEKYFPPMEPGALRSLLSKPSFMIDIVGRNS